MTYKKKTSNLSPHNSRIFSAGFRLILGLFAWGALLSIISLNFTMSQQAESPIKRDKTFMVTQPDSASVHIALAQKYWSLQQPKLARQELTLAQEIYQQQKKISGNVLGIASDPLSLYDQWEKRTGFNSGLYDYWKDIVVNRPDYRDGFLQLASISYQLSKYDEANKYIDAALRLDPNSITAHELKNILTSLSDVNQNESQ